MCNCGGSNNNVVANYSSPNSQTTNTNNTHQQLLDQYNAQKEQEQIALALRGAATSPQPQQNPIYTP